MYGLVLEQKDTKETKNSRGKPRRDSLNVGDSHRGDKRKTTSKTFPLALDVPATRVQSRIR